MSKVIKWKYSDIFQSRKGKLINLLFGEIIFLKSHAKKFQLSDEQQYFRNALNKLEYTLNLLRNFEKDLSDEEFDKFMKVIYEIVKEIVQSI